MLSLCLTTNSESEGIELRTLHLNEDLQVFENLSLEGGVEQACSGVHTPQREKNSSDTDMYLVV